MRQPVTARAAAAAPAAGSDTAVPGPAGAALPVADPPRPGELPRWRRAVAEALGTGVLVTAIVGSGIAASRLSPDEPGLQLAYHAAATGATLAVLVTVFGPVSGAHFNPAVTLVDWLRERRRAGATTTAATYLAAQLAGGAGGAVLANVMFGLAPVAIGGTGRAGSGLWLGEVVATAGLVLVIGALRGNRQPQVIGLALGGWIAAAIWFTASSAFANPAVTLARTLTGSVTGIAPGSAPGFIAAQLAGAGLGAGLVWLFWPARSGDERT